MVFKFVSFLGDLKKTAKVSLMPKVFADNQLVFEGSMSRLGGGGTKTAHHLNGTDFVVLLPNEVDGAPLERVFPRICHEEETIYKYMHEHSIALSLPVKTCCVTLDDNKVLFGLYAPSFESYVNKGAYVLDSKDRHASCWNSKLCINPTFFDPDSWLPIFTPLVQDLERLLHAGITPFGDCLNFIITTPAFTNNHVDSLVPYQVRFFGFDFTSKRYVSQLAESINALEPGTVLKPVLDVNYLEQALETAVDLVLSVTRPQVMNETDKDLEAFRTLYNHVHARLMRTLQ